MQEYETLKTLVAEIEDEVNKAQSGNKAAGTRVRKQMQQIKQVAQEIRKAIIELKTTE
jgi:hypothetical protein